MYNQMMNINRHFISDGDLFMFVVSLKNGEKFTVSIGDSKSELYKLNLDNPIVRTLTNRLRGKDPGYIAILPDVFSNKNHSSPDIIKSVFESFMRVTEEYDDSSFACFRPDNSLWCASAI